jgi:hypothetical protein
MRTRTVLQSFRKYNDFEDFEVLGSQYGYHDGVEWHVAVSSESDRPLRVFHVVGGVPEDRLTGKHLEAVQAAIRFWEANLIWAD